MESNRDILHTLQAVIATDLLAPSMSALATTLGYKGRNTFYRILKGEAGESAAEGLLRRLEERLRVGANDLLRMEAAITNAADFSRLIKPEMNLDYPDWQFQVLIAFIFHDYSHFSPTFRDGDLKRILLFERTDPRTFFNMLAWFYVKSLHPDFYNPSLTHSQRCAAIIEPLGERLKQIFPGNGLGVSTAYAYSISEVYHAEPDTLWSLVKSVSVMLEAFASPVSTTEKDCRYRLIPGIPERTYWQGADTDKVLLTWIRQGRDPCTGHYEVFSIDRASGRPECLVSIFILSEEIASVFTKSDTNTRIAVYSLESEKLSFEWEDPTADPMGTGNRWTRHDPASSQSLRELDRSLTDDVLLREMASSEGFEYDTLLQPIDVIISRRRLTLLLTDGSRHSIDVDFTPFLRSLVPSEPIIVCRQLADSRLFAIWPEIRQSIPLNLFD